MLKRRHHNNKGYRQIRNGGTTRAVLAIAKKLGIPYGDSEFMPGRIVVQPNGLYARFSTVVDNFTDYGMSRADAVKLSSESAVHSGEWDLSRWKRALETIAQIHGKEERDAAENVILGLSQK